MLIYIYVAVGIFLGVIHYLSFRQDLIMPAAIILAIMAGMFWIVILPFEVVVFSYLFYKTKGKL